MSRHVDVDFYKYTTVELNYTLPLAGGQGTECDPVRNQRSIGPRLPDLLTTEIGKVKFALISWVLYLEFRAQSVIQQKHGPLIPTVCLRLIYWLVDLILVSLSLLLSHPRRVRRP